MHFFGFCDIPIFWGTYDLAHIVVEWVQCPEKREVKEIYCLSDNWLFVTSTRCLLTRFMRNWFFFPFSAFKSANYTIKLCYGIALSHFFVKQNFETTVSYRAESPSKFINPLKMSLLFLWSILSRKLNSAWPTCKQKSKQLLGGV